MDRVLVTGGAGFIGSHLVRRLVDMGYEVKVLDDLSTGSRRNLSRLENKIEFIHGDVRSYDIVERAVKDVDTVVHLAGKTSVDESIREPRLYHSVNVLGTVNLLEACVKEGVKYFIYTSTCAVYGEPEKLPVSEDAPVNPISPYAASKLAAEAYCKAYSASYGLETLILRLFNVYGPKLYGNHSDVVSKFISRVARDEPPIIYGDGEQTRDFIYISDVIEYMIRALSKRLSGDVLNIGLGEAVSINGLANLIVNMMGKHHLKPLYGDSKPGDIRNMVANTSRVSALLDYKPRVKLEDGLKMTIGSMKF